MIPPFDSHGNLPPGIHHAVWDEIEQRFGTNTQRRFMLTGLRAALESFRRANCPVVYLDGSFVTAKSFPAGYDACWSIVGTAARPIDPILLDFGPAGRAAQKARYGGEFFPAELPEGASGIPYLVRFQRDRAGNQRGIIAIDMQGLP